MVIRNVLIILLATSVTVKTDDLDDICDISSDFIPSLYTGLINYYKYEEVDQANALIKNVYENIEKFAKLYLEALHGDYDSLVFGLGYFTVEISDDLRNILNKLDEMNADSSYKLVQEIASLITTEKFNEASNAIFKLENEILIYKIVEHAYKFERQNHAMLKLLKFGYHLLETRNMTVAIALEVSLFRELSADPNNLYTRSMVSLAELVRETMEKYYEVYRDTPNYKEWNKRLHFIQLSVPEIVQKLVFLKGFKFPSYICIKNLYWKERMFVGDFHYDNDQNRRILYTTNETIDLPNQQWNMYYNSTKFGYLIRNVLYDEFLHNAEDAILYDDENRFIFTKSKETDPKKGYWAFIPVDVNYFAIKNVVDDEFMYAIVDVTFKEVYHKRRVFSFKVKGDFKSRQYNSQLWSLEVC